jgi:pyruvate kinase
MRPGSEKGSSAGGRLTEPETDFGAAASGPGAQTRPVSTRSLKDGSRDAEQPSADQHEAYAEAQAALIEPLRAIREELLTEAEGWRPWTEKRASDRDASARNLLQYLALRRHDLRELQDPLVALGLSSLGRSEGHVQATVDAVISALSALLGDPPALGSRPAPISLAHSRELLEHRTRALLGPAPPGRSTRIMVTMPAEAAEDPAVVRDMLVAGMDCMRINCAHDGPAEWRAMYDNLQRGQAETGRRARVEVDLAGPKLRTGPVVSKPKQDRKGDYVRLRVDDRLLLVRDAGSAAGAAAPESPARIICSLDDAFALTRVGHRIWLDDGKLAGVVEALEPDSIELRITTAQPKGSKLRAEKGINLPDAALQTDLLDSDSQEALDFAVAYADMIGLSFVSHATEVKLVHNYLHEHARPDLGIVLKIETRRAFEQLPGLLLAALAGGGPAGVMIARGDLAVECGYERLAEVQEEILWLCEAAHLPVIWATQVLDQLAKTGRPSRAEITDAAMGVRAECVMLNKGPRIIEAIAVLDDILRRMAQHQAKKRSLLRRLRASEYVRTPPPIDPSEPTS